MIKIRNISVEEVKTVDIRHIKYTIPGIRSLADPIKIDRWDVRINNIKLAGSFISEQDAQQYLQAQGVL